MLLAFAAFCSETTMADTSRPCDQVSTSYTKTFERDTGMEMDVAHLLPLTEKYSARVPRYTSYPTAVEFTPNFSPEQWMRELRADIHEQGPKTSLYLHIPFCKTLCFFCACAREGGTNRSRVSPYLYSVMKELASYAEFAPDMEISQLHLGGGSPNYLNPDDLCTVIEAFRGFLPRWSENAELSIEFDPRETSLIHVRAARQLGFSRISFGVQDFHPDVQRAIHRKQSKEATALLVQESRAQGIGEINFDLIYGLPEQTLDTWRSTIIDVLELRPDRLAVYGYAHVDWRAKNQQAFNTKCTLPTPQERVALFSLAHQMLTEAGYYYLGMDHFALENDTLSRAHREGTMRRNFMGYSTQAGVRVLGLGASAISSTKRTYAQNHIPIQEYNSAIHSLGSAVARGMNLNEDDILRKEIIEDIMCKGRLDLHDYAGRYTGPLDALFPNFEERLEQLRSDELITKNGSIIQATQTGRYFLRTIASLFDSYLPKYTGGQKVFSSSC